MVTKVSSICSRGRGCSSFIDRHVTDGFQIVTSGLQEADNIDFLCDQAEYGKISTTMFPAILRFLLWAMGVNCGHRSSPKKNLMSTFLLWFYASCEKMLPNTLARFHLFRGCKIKNNILTKSLNSLSIAGR